MYNILLSYMNSDLMYKLLKYLIQGIIIYVLFKYVPQQPMNDKDILLITIIVLLVYAVIENFYNLYDNKHGEQIIHQVQEPLAQQCQSYCSVQENNEHMGNVSAPPTVSSDINSSASQNSCQSSASQNSCQSSASQNSCQSSALPEDDDQLENEKNKMADKIDTFVQEKYKSKNNNQPANHTISGIRAPSATYRVPETNHELAYNYMDYNSMPISTNVNVGSFESGYSFLPPSQWYPVPPHPPVCVAEKKCPVCPVYTNVETMDLKEWNSSNNE